MSGQGIRLRGGKRVSAPGEAIPSVTVGANGSGPRKEVIIQKYKSDTLAIKE